MSKVIKEIIIMLLICLVIMLIFAVVFYEYIPNRKVVAEVTTYTPSDKTQELLADNIDSKEDEVVLTYEVTSSDLNNYEITNEYVPGRVNPFAEVSEGVDGEVPDGNNTAKDDNTDSTSGNTTNSFFPDKGTK